MLRIVNRCSREERDNATTQAPSPTGAPPRAEHSKTRVAQSERRQGSVDVQTPGDHCRAAGAAVAQWELRCTRSKRGASRPPPPPRTTTGAQGTTRELPQVPTHHRRAEPKGPRRGRASKLPSTQQLRAWQLATRDDVARASGSPDAGVRWTLEVGNKSYDELGNRGPLPTLSSKLAATLSKPRRGFSAIR